MAFYDGLVEFKVQESCRCLQAGANRLNLKELIAHHTSSTLHSVPKGTAAYYIQAQASVLPPGHSLTKPRKITSSSCLIPPFSVLCHPCWFLIDRRRSSQDRINYFTVELINRASTFDALFHHISIILALHRKRSLALL